MGDTVAGASRYGAALYASEQVARRRSRAAAEVYDGVASRVPAGPDPAGGGQDRERDWQDVSLSIFRSFAIDRFLFDRILNGFDCDGRPVLYMRPGKENTETSPRQVRHLVWWL